MVQNPNTIAKDRYLDVVFPNGLVDLLDMEFLEL